MTEQLGSVISYMPLFHKQPHSSSSLKQNLSQIQTIIHHGPLKLLTSDGNYMFNLWMPSINYLYLLSMSRIGQKYLSQHVEEVSEKIFR